MLLDYAAIRKMFIAVLVASVMFSIAYIALGIWILSDPSLMSYWLNQIVVTDYGALTTTLRITSYLPIGLGLVAIASFSVGAAHAMRGGMCLMIAYVVITSVAVLLEVVLTLVPMSMWSQVSAELPLYLKATLQNEYRGLPNGQSLPNSIIWDAMQVELECCGFNGPSDYTKNYRTYANNWHSSYRYYQADSSSYSGLSYMFPVSCCTFSDKSVITRLDFSNYENYVSDKRCPVDGVSYYNSACPKRLEDYVYVYFCVILAASFVMLVVHVTAIALSIFLIKRRLVPEAADGSMGSVRSLVSLRRIGSSGKVSPSPRWVRQQPAARMQRY